MEEVQKRVIKLTSQIYIGKINFPEPDFVINLTSVFGEKYQKKVHKFVFAANSEYFKILFEYCKGEQTEVKELSPETFEIIMEYFYTDKLRQNLCFRKMNDVYRWADFLIAPRLLTAIENLKIMYEK